MKRLTTFLSGKRTYLAAAVMVVLSGLRAEGYLDEATYQLAVATAAAAGLAGLRAAIPTKKKK